MIVFLDLKHETRAEDKMKDKLFLHRNIKFWCGSRIETPDFDSFTPLIPSPQRVEISEPKWLLTLNFTPIEFKKTSALIIFYLPLYVNKNTYF